MRKYFVLLILTMLFASFDPYEDTILLLSVSSENTARIGVLNNSDKTLKLTMLNSNEQVISTERISPKKNLFTFYNLSKLAYGKYIFTLKLPDDSELKKVLIKDENSTEVISNKRIHTPDFEFENNILTLSLFNQNKDFVQVSINDYSGTLYQKNFERDMLINEQFNLEALPRGAYAAILETSYNTYKYQFEKP